MGETCTVKRDSEAIEVRQRSTGLLHVFIPGIIDVFFIEFDNPEQRTQMRVFLGRGARDSVGCLFLTACISCISYLRKLH